jgi:hypothetical protein
MKFLRDLVAGARETPSTPTPRTAVTSLVTRVFLCTTEERNRQGSAKKNSWWMRVSRPTFRQKPSPDDFTLEPTKTSGEHEIDRPGKSNQNEWTGIHREDGKPFGKTCVCFPGRTQRSSTKEDHFVLQTRKLFAKRVRSIPAITPLKLRGSFFLALFYAPPSPPGNLMTASTHTSSRSRDYKQCQLSSNGHVPSSGLKQRVETPLDSASPQGGAFNFIKAHFSFNRSS